MVSRKHLNKGAIMFVVLLGFDRNTKYKTKDVEIGLNLEYAVRSVLVDTSSRSVMIEVGTWTG